MKIRVFAEKSITANVSSIVDNLNTLVKKVTFEKGVATISIKNDYVSNPKSYKDMLPVIRSEIKSDDLTLVFTNKQYDNNYFWDSPDYKLIIVSMYDWDKLTTLSRNNGIVYFISALITRELGVGIDHSKKNIGCVNDFWQDKTGIDVGMRSAYICEKCKKKPQKQSIELKEYMKDIELMLNVVSDASRLNKDICDYWGSSKKENGFDVFLCHNSIDKPSVRLLNQILAANGIKTWLDEEQLPPGRVWQELLEQQIESIKSVAVLVGESGLGPWQDVEMRAFISEFVKRKCAVIPVILNTCQSVPKLPLFLSQFMWVDFRKESTKSIDYLIWGITGKKPKAG